MFLIDIFWLQKLADGVGDVDSCAGSVPYDYRSTGSVWPGFENDTDGYSCRS